MTGSRRPLAAALALAAAASTALAQGTRPGRSLQIVNASPRSLVEFVVFQEDVYATLPNTVPPGKRATLALPAFKACKASYQMGLKDAPPLTKDVDLCRSSVVHVREE